MQLWFAGANDYCIKLTTEDALALLDDLLAITNKSNQTKELIQHLLQDKFIMELRK